MVLASGLNTVAKVVQLAAHPLAGLPFSVIGYVSEMWLPWGELSSADCLLPGQPQFTSSVTLTTCVISSKSCWMVQLDGGSEELSQRELHLYTVVPPSLWYVAGGNLQPRCSYHSVFEELCEAARSMELP